jgi:hypothetical protein
VLLNNGGLFEGTVQRAPDAVTVEGDGTYIRLRTADVAHVAESLVAAYEWKRAQMGEGGLVAIDHLELADWAIENHLWEQAARELLDARQLAPTSGRLELLERRLDEAFRVANIGAPQKTPTPSERTEALNGTPAAAPDDDFQRPALPHGALEQFTRRIQPVLLNSCATSGCHGAEPAGGFAFDVASLRGYGDLRSTERNLDRTLELIDLPNPAASKLLTIAKGPHAGVTPIGGQRREEMLQRISEWAHKIALHNAPPVATEAPAAAGPMTTVVTTVAQQLPTAAPAPTAIPTAPVASTPPAASVPTASEASAEPDWVAIVAAAEAKPAEIKHGVQLERVGPRDEFDPAVFNTRYRRPQDDQPME